MINRKYYDHSIVVNLLIQYVRAHEVNNLSGYTGEFIDKLYEYIPGSMSLSMMTMPDPAVRLPIGSLWIFGP